MDRSELIARDHLVHRGCSAPRYEPDGNVPPDFLVDERLAVEVRRLNENERNTLVPKGLEETEIPLLIGLQRLTSSFGPPSGQAWWLALRFSRPVPSWKVLGPRVRTFLEGVRDGPPAPTHAQDVDSHVRIEAFARPADADEMFHVAITSDEDSGGWLLEELERNVRLVIGEKTKKIAPFRNRYPEWWLLLIDHVAFGMTEFDREQWRASVTMQHTWDRVVLVNPLAPHDFFEL